MRRMLVLLGLVLMFTSLCINVQADELTDLKITGLEYYNLTEFPIKTDLSKQDFTDKVKVYYNDGTEFVGLNLIVDFSKVNVKKHGIYDVDYYFIDFNNSKHHLETIQIMMIDSIKPVLQASDIFIPLYSKNINYKDYIQVFDDSGLVTKNDVSVISHVDLTSSGVYYVNYFVTDAGGNVATATSKVYVLEHKVDDKDAPEIKNVKESIKVVKGTNLETALIQFVEGIQALDGTVDLTEFLLIDYSHVDLLMVGSYPLHYYVSDKSGNHTTVTTKVEIVDEDTTPPLITAPDVIFVTINTIYDFKNDVQVYDEVGGDLSSLVTYTQKDYKPNTIGNYTVTYFVEDYSGNKAEKTVIVKVVDNVGPKITVSKTVQVRKNESLDLSKHIKVIDNFDQSVNYTVDASKLNLNAEGTYAVVVTAIDQAGNETKETFFVNVYNKSYQEKIYENPIIMGSIVAMGVSLVVVSISSLFGKKKRKFR